MKTVLWRASARHLQRHPWQLGLAILGVGLGVAVMVAIDIASSSALRAFDLSTQTVTGRATHSIEGGVNGLSTEVYRKIRLELHLRDTAPIVESFVSPIHEPTRSLRLLGIDPFAETRFRGFTEPLRDPEFDLAGFLTTPGAALLSPQTADDLGIGLGSSFEIDVGGRTGSLRLLGFLDSPEEAERLALTDLLITDIATAQEVLGLGDRLTRIDLQIPQSERDEAILSSVRSILPGDAVLIQAEGRSDTARQMTRAFRLNLQALSLLGLLCGAFLIYNTMTFAVVQRRNLMATLRALGTTRRQIVMLVLGEALAVGLLGVILGELAGWALGRSLVHLVTRTINDLYFVLNVRQVAIEPWVLAKGALIGLGTTATAAMAPAWEASSAAPRAALSRADLEARTHRALPVATAGGIGLVFLGIALLCIPGQHLLPAFAGLFAILLGLALLAPLATLGLMALLTPLAGAVFGQLGRVATRGVSAALSRTGVAVAALMIALSVTVGVDLMIRSFRATVSDWLEYTLPADLYVSVFTTQARRYSTVGSTLDAEVYDKVRAVAGVAGANALRHFSVRLNGLQTRAIAIDLDSRAKGVFRFKQGDVEAAWKPFEAGKSAIISEPLAHRSGLRSGDRVQLATPGGQIELEVAGIYYDYSSEQGVLFIDRDVYLRHWRDDRLTALSLHAARGADLDVLEDSIREVLGPGNRAQIISNHQLRARSLEVFDRTFVITGVLRLLAVIVAFVGVLSSLMALQMERTREFGVLRACGLTPGQVWHLVTQQTGLMGLAAGLLSLPVGIVMAAIMIFIINRRSFGWSLHMEIASSSLGQALVVAMVAALLAGLYPAWRVARASPGKSLREE